MSVNHYSIDALKYTALFIKTKEKDMRKNEKTFRVGDRVRCLEKNYSFCGQIGTICEIRDGLYDVNGFIDKEHGVTPRREWIHFKGDLELVSPHLNPKYKVGDMVEYIRATAHNPQLPITDVFIAYEIGNRMEMFRENELKPYIKLEKYQLCLTDLTKEQCKEIKRYLKD
jgi:hypothetical protein